MHTYVIICFHNAVHKHNWDTSRQAHTQFRNSCTGMYLGCNVSPSWGVSRPHTGKDNQRKRAVPPPARDQRVWRRELRSAYESFRGRMTKRGVGEFAVPDILPDTREGEAIGKKRLP